MYTEMNPTAIAVDASQLSSTDPLPPGKYSAEMQDVNGQPVLSVKAVDGETSPASTHGDTLTPMGLISDLIRFGGKTIEVTQDDDGSGVIFALVGPYVDPDNPGKERWVQISVETSFYAGD